MECRQIFIIHCVGLLLGIGVPEQSHSSFKQTNKTPSSINPNTIPWKETIQELKSFQSMDQPRIWLIESI